MMHEPDLATLLRLVAKHDQREDLWWNQDLEFTVDCSDVFHWACADAEPVETLKDVIDLSVAYDETPLFGAALYAARRRRMRPQDPAIPEGPVGDLFRACGPERTKEDQG